MKITDVRKYLLEEEFKIILTSKFINIINYTDIGHFDNKNITIYYNEGSIKIIGDNMSVSKLLNKEILITGKINNIELR